MVKIAVVGVGHWHAPMYIKALRDSDLPIAALADPDGAALRRVGADLDCASYSSLAELLEREQPDFVFAHAPHDEMTAVVAELVAARVAFTIEKPAGLDWRELQTVATQADDAGLFGAVSLVARTYPLVRRCRELLEAGELGAPTHYYYRLFAGEPSRYREWHVPWMLDPDRAGAGCLHNFGPHVIDLVHYLTGQPIVEVFCRLSSLTHDEPVPDLACLVMRTEGGALAAAEVSYTMPTAYERFFSFSSTAIHCSGDLDTGTVWYRDGREEQISEQSGDWTLRYVQDVIRRFEAGERPLATLGDMAQTLRVINAAAESHETGQAIELPPSGPV